MKDRGHMGRRNSTGQVFLPLRPRRAYRHSSAWTRIVRTGGGVVRNGGGDDALRQGGRRGERLRIQEAHRLLIFLICDCLFLESSSGLRLNSKTYRLSHKSPAHMSCAWRLNDPISIRRCVARTAAGHVHHPATVGKGLRYPAALIQGK